MSTAGPSAPATMGTASRASGVYTWTNANNAKASDNSYATCDVCAASKYAGSNGASCYIDGLKLIKAGTIGGSDKGTTGDYNLYLSDHTHTYGGAADLWGNTLTDTDVNNSGFGVALGVNQTQDGTSSSDWLKATNFGFAIPSGATINGITVALEMKGDATAPPTGKTYVDYISITVDYTTGGGGGLSIPVAAQAYRQRRV